MSDGIQSLTNIIRQQDEPQPEDCKKEQPLKTGDLTEISEPETVQGQHGRDGVIHRIEIVGGRYYRLRCRAITEGRHGYLRVEHSATYLSYLFSFDAAEAWAYRGEIPTTDDGRAITVESR